LNSFDARIGATKVIYKCFLSLEDLLWWQRKAIYFDKCIWGTILYKFRLHGLGCHHQL